MPRYRSIQNSFLSGKLSKRFLGRTDLKEYFQGCEEYQNFLTDVSGGAVFRPGTTVPSRDADLGPHSAINTAFPLLGFTSSVDGFTNARMFSGRLSSGSEILILITPSTNMYIVSNADLRFPSSAISHPFDDATLHQIRMAQIGDLFVFVQPSVEPQVLSGSTLTAWKDFDDTDLTRVALDTMNAGEAYRVQKYPFGSVNLNETSALTYTGTTTVGTSGTMSSSYDLFTSDDVGRYIRQEDGANVRIYEITGFTNATTVSVVTRSVGTNTAIFKWSMSLWGKGGKYPRDVVVHDNRLVFAFGNQVNFSATNDFFRMSEQYDFSSNDIVTVPNDRTDITLTNSGFSVAIPPEDSSEIEWLQSGPYLMAGTRSDEWIIRGSDVSSPRVDDNYIQRRSSVGARPLSTKNQERMYFVGNSGQKIYELDPSGDVNRYVLEDISFFSDDILFDKDRVNFSANVVPDTTAQLPRIPDTWRAREDGEFRRVVTTRHDVPIVWCVDNKGLLYSFTRETRQNLVAWSEHVLGGELEIDAGQFDTSNVDISDDSISSIQPPDFFLGNFTYSPFNKPRKVRFRADQTGSVMPGGLIAGSDYWLIPLRDKFIISNTEDGEKIDITSQGSGDIAIMFVDTPRVIDIAPFRTTEGSVALAMLVIRRFRGDTDTFSGAFDGEYRVSLEYLNVGSFNLKNYKNWIPSIGTINGSGRYFAPATNYMDHMQTGLLTGSTTTIALDEIYLGLTFQVVLNGKFIGSVTFNTHDAANNRAVADVSSFVTNTKDTAFARIGLLYEGLVKSMPIEAGSASQSAQGAINHIDEVNLRFYRSMGAKIGAREDRLTEIQMLDPNSRMDEILEFFTGDKVISFESQDDRKQQVIVKQDKPYPCRLLSMVYRGVEVD